jgi:hypothetical protein
MRDRVLAKATPDGVNWWTRPNPPNLSLSDGPSEVGLSKPHVTPPSTTSERRVTTQPTELVATLRGHSALLRLIVCLDSPPGDCGYKGDGGGNHGRRNIMKRASFSTRLAGMLVLFTGIVLCTTPSHAVNERWYMHANCHPTDPTHRCRSSTVVRCPRERSHRRQPRKSQNHRNKASGKAGAFTCEPLKLQCSGPAHEGSTVEPSEE